MKHFILSSIAGLALVACAQAQQFQIPKEQAKELTGEWKVIMMSDGKEMQAVPDKKRLGMLFSADGTGLQLKNQRQIPIVWGADANGAFAAQWMQPNGRGDGIMGTWKLTERGLELDVTEFEDGQGPGEDHVVLLLERVVKE